MTDLLLQELPALPKGSQTPEAVALKGEYAYDDTESHIPPTLRNRIPNALKQNGKFHLYQNEEGFLYQKHPGGQWGLVLFVRNGTHFHIVLPLNYLLIGKCFRTLLEKQRDSQSSMATTLITTQPDHPSQAGNTILERFIKTVWNDLQQQKDISRLLDMGNDRYQEIFSNLGANIDGIIAGLVPEARRIFQDGNFGLQDILGLPDAQTHLFPGQFIYLLVYLDMDGIEGVGFYVGQTQNIKGRITGHSACTDNGTPTAHYDIARRSKPWDRHMFILCFWDDHPVSQVVLDMAEQTMILALKTYNPIVASSNPKRILKPRHQLSNDQATILRSIARQARRSTGWQDELDVDVLGCNITSPVFVASTPPVIECFRIPSLGPKRAYTMYKKPIKFHPLGDKARRLKQKRLHVALNYRDQDGKNCIHNFSFDEKCFQGIMPKYGYLVFEIMDDGQPHDKPWLGCPSVGPFRHFDQVSSLGIRIEWCNKDTWLTVPIINLMQSQNKSLGGFFQMWKRGLTIIQLLEGITWSGPLEGVLSDLNRSASFGSRIVTEVAINHLQQTCRWIPRRGKVLPVPALASWSENFQLMATQFGKGETVICRQQPPMDDAFWEAGRAGTASQMKRRNTGMIRCDFCKYSQRRAADTTIICERDTNYGDIWVCKPCSRMGRPCTFTPVSVAQELWGTDPPLIDHSYFSQYPNGPHRKLAFHKSFSPAVEVTPIAIPKPFGVDQDAIEIELMEGDDGDSIADEDYGNED
ncbi:hypothetical protein FBULB1_2839 [Fusarium bulbicola]|nr:hypothetical protein FBULB1_2839 [Fusarium bulbicola]